MATLARGERKQNGIEGIFLRNLQQGDVIEVIDISGTSYKIRILPRGQAAVIYGDGESAQRFQGEIGTYIKDEHGYQTLVKGLITIGLCPIIWKEGKSELICPSPQRLVARKKDGGVAFVVPPEQDSS